MEPKRIYQNAKTQQRDKLFKGYWLKKSHFLYTLQFKLNIICFFFFKHKWKALPQSVIYSKNDPGGAFLNKEYAFLYNKLYTECDRMWDRNTGKGKEENGSSNSLNLKKRLQDGRQPYLQMLILSLLKACTSWYDKLQMFIIGHSGCQAGGDLEEKDVMQASKNCLRNQSCTVLNSLSSTANETAKWRETIQHVKALRSKVKWIPQRRNN